MILLDPTSAIEFDRYLVPFDLRRVPTYRFDVVVMGSGVVARDTSVPADTARVAGVVDVVADAVADAALAAVVAREEVEGEVATAVNANK